MEGRQGRGQSPCPGSSDARTAQACAARSTLAHFHCGQDTIRNGPHKLSGIEAWAMRARVVVVGGGIAGLVAAIDLARAGMKPVLIGQARKLGGAAQTRILDGCHFNQGPHALYVAGALNTMLAEFGVEISGGRPDVAAGLGLWGLKAHPLPIGLARGAPATPLDREDAAVLASQLRRIGRGDYDGLGQPLRAITAPWPRDVRTVIEALVRPDGLCPRTRLDRRQGGTRPVALELRRRALSRWGFKASLVAGLAAGAPHRQPTCEPKAAYPQSLLRRRAGAWRCSARRPSPATPSY